MGIRKAIADWISGGLIEELEAEADFACEALASDALAKRADRYHAALEAIILEPHRAHEIAERSISSEHL